MESLKPILLCLVLGGVGYSVYVALSHAPPAEPSSNTTTQWNQAPAAPAGPTAQSATESGANAAPSSGGSATSAPPHADSPLGASAVNSLPFGLGSSVGRAPPSDPATQSGPAILSPNGYDSRPPGNAAVAPSNGTMGADSRPADSTQVINATGPGPMMSPPGAAPFGNNAATGTVANPAADLQARHDYEAAVRAAQTLLKQGQLVEALRELSRWYDNPAVPPEDQAQFIELLSQLAGTVIYSRDPWLAPPYQVRVGDSLESIAEQCQVPAQLLAKINGVQNPSNLLPGEKLKLVRGPFQAQLNVQQGWLAVFVDGMYAGRFRVEMAGPIAKPDGAYPVAKFTADNSGAGGKGPYISLGGDLHIRMPDDAPPPGVSAAQINRQDLDDVFDMLSERSQVMIRR